MDKTQHITYPVKSLIVYKTLLFLYPKAYQKRFSEQMLLVFQDAYQEEIEKHGYASIGFLLSNMFDLLASAITQHLDMIHKYGFKKFFQQFHISIYSIIGLILVLPFFLALTINFLVVLLTGKREAMEPLYHSIFWQFPILPIWLLGFPALAIVLNLIPIAQNIRKHTLKVMTWSFVGSNLASLVIVLIGIGIFGFIKLHDVIPCIVNMILSHGLFNIGNTVAFCRNA